MFDATLDALESELRAALNAAVTGLVATARTRLEEAVAEIAKERAKGLAEVAQERADLHREIEAMQTHQAQQEGRVELNIGGYRFQTSVQTLRRVPHTFFDTYFSGRYAQDVCNDGSIFVDRDGEYCGHILKYMRDGVVSVAEPGAYYGVSLLRALKREFGFYCIELCIEQPVEEAQPEALFVMGGYDPPRSCALSSMERYKASTGQWSASASMVNRRRSFGACSVAGMLYVTGGVNEENDLIDSVEKYLPTTGIWSTVHPLPSARESHAAVAVGSAMYIIGGTSDGNTTDTTLKYNSIQDAWIEVAPMPVLRDSFVACAYESDIYDEYGENQASAFKFDTEANVWSTLAPMPFVCTDNGASLLDGQVYIVGAGNSEREVLRFNPMTNAWEMLARTINLRDGGNSFVLAGCLYAAGGTDASTSASVERYDVATNIWTAVADMLEVRQYFCVVCIESKGPAEEQDLFDSLIAKVLTQPQHT